MVQRPPWVRGQADRSIVGTGRFCHCHTADVHADERPEVTAAAQAVWRRAWQAHRNLVAWPGSRGTSEARPGTVFQRAVRSEILGDLLD